MNEQEIFDKVVTHLGKQRVRSETSTGKCLYRGPNGTMCAVGCLIPDELYDPEMEGAQPLSMLPALMRAFKAAGISDEHLEFLSELQRIHDRRLVDNWAAHLNNIGLENGLDTSVVRKAFK